MTEKKVLIVDDSLTNLTIISDILNHNNISLSLKLIVLKLNLY